MKLIYIYGCLGSMARRYRAILEHLGHEWAGEDLDGQHGGFRLRQADAVIIATPTDTHMGLIRQLIDIGKPVLCEKPIMRQADALGGLRALMADVVRAGMSLQMVSQYDHLVTAGGSGETRYDYWRSGPDGLAWDCLQIVRHAVDVPTLRNKSPMWDCTINGQRLSIADMDGAYFLEIRNWLAAPRNDVSRILESHEKVASLEASWSRGS